MDIKYFYTSPNVKVTEVSFGGVLCGSFDSTVAPENPVWTNDL